MPFHRTTAAAFLAVLSCLGTGIAEDIPAGVTDMKEFALRYAEAWCSQDPARVAAFFAEDGSLTINGGTPSVGRAAIAEAARSFMTAYPDMTVDMESLEQARNKYRFHWLFTGINGGPGGTGRTVSIKGYEEWTIGPGELIADSQGHYDAADWARQAGP